MNRRSQWLDDVAADALPFREINQNTSVDVAIIGGGYVGLWTAIELKMLEPGLQVAVFEMNRCGDGASGLNGGFVMSWWPKIASLVRVCGQDDAVWLADETTHAVQDLGAFLENHAVDAEYRQSGWLWAATTPKHIGAWNSVMEAAQRFGRSDVFQQLPGEEIAARTGSAVHLAGIWERINATVHPGKLVRGLAAIADKLGVQIHENCPVRQLVRSSPVRLELDKVTVTAKKVVVATNAWAAKMPELRRKFVCVGSAIVMTPPIPDRLAEIGWTGGESITDSQTTVNYYRTTRNGRIAFGKGGGRLYYTGEPSHEVFKDTYGIQETVSDFRRVYPMLADVPLAATWSGPIDRTYDSLPLLGTLAQAPNIVFGVGWSGNGVNPSRIGGRILARLVLERKDRWVQNGLVNRHARPFPPEPFRYIGGSMVRAAMMRKDKTELSGGDPAFLDRWLAQLAPAGLEDKV